MLKNVYMFDIIYLYILLSGMLSCFWGDRTMTLFEIFESEKIEYYAPIELSRVKIQKPYLLSRCSVSAESGSALMICVPYFSGVPENISAYAASRDYHLYFEGLFDRIIPKLKELYPGYSFYGFADRSPISEVYAAALAGLGMIGENHLFISEKYSSFVFLGEIISDMPATQYGMELYEGNVRECKRCGACAKKCPAGLDAGECLSALTQKKGELDEDQKRRLIEHGVAWGCDICQNVCPYTRAAADSGSIYTPIDFFYEKRIEKIDTDSLYAMSDEEFFERAFSWRGKETLERNLKILGGER